MGCKLVPQSKLAHSFKKFVNVPSHAADLEVTEMRAILLLRLARELVREELYGAHGGDEVVNVVLREVADPEPTVLRDVPRDRLQVSHEQLDSVRTLAKVSGWRSRDLQSRLSGAVRPNDGHA